MKLDFQTGKLLQVAMARRSDRRREYGLLVIVSVISSLPYVAAMVFRPLATTIVVLFMAYFQVMIAFATSTSTDTAHAVRFLLSGSNPIGMTGSSSLVLGAVDAIIDWTEDAAERRRRPWMTWALTVYKFAMTPIGYVLMIIEFSWDALLLGRRSIIRDKWTELFSLAYYHDLICPEKSNDIFYADLAYAKYKGDAAMYQWNRLRSMVFELEHYRVEVVQGLGAPETNVFLQSEVAAYQTLKRLELESIENAILKHHRDNEDWFPFPRNLADNLISNARPMHHYLRMRGELLSHPRYVCQFDEELAGLIGEQRDRKYRSWHILRLLDCKQEVVDKHRLGDYFDESVITDLISQRIVCQTKSCQLCLDDDFRDELEHLIMEHCAPIPADEVQLLRLAQVPEFFDFRGGSYTVRR